LTAALRAFGYFFFQRVFISLFIFEPEWALKEKRDCAGDISIVSHSSCKRMRINQTIFLSIFVFVKMLAFYVLIWEIIYQEVKQCTIT